MKLIYAGTYQTDVHYKSSNFKIRGFASSGKTLALQLSPAYAEELHRSPRASLLLLPFNPTRANTPGSVALTHSQPVLLVRKRYFPRALSTTSSYKHAGRQLKLPGMARSSWALVLILLDQIVVRSASQLTPSQLKVSGRSVVDQVSIAVDLLAA